MILVKTINQKVIDDITSGRIRNSVVIQDKLIKHAYHEEFLDIENSLLMYDRTNIKLPHKWEVVDVRGRLGVCSVAMHDVERSITSLIIKITNGIRDNVWSVNTGECNDEDTTAAIHGLIHFLYDNNAMLRWKPSKDFMVSVILFMSNVHRLMMQSNINRRHITTYVPYKNGSYVVIYNVILAIIENKIAVSYPEIKKRITRKNCYNITYTYIESWFKKILVYVGATEFKSIFGYSTKTGAIQSYFRLISHESMSTTGISSIYSSNYHKKIIGINEKLQA